MELYTKQRTNFNFGIQNIYNFFLNKQRLPAENPDRLFSVKLFGNAPYPAQPTFYFNQTQLTQSNPA